MKLSLLPLAILVLGLCTAGISCDSGGDCGLEAGRWSTATSGGLCQANFFGDTDYAVYCAENADGNFECACGAASENPLEFTSTDFCDIDGEERACRAIELCNFPL